MTTLTTQLKRQDLAKAFAKRWQKETDEKQYAQSFWFKFFEIFGLDASQDAHFEKRVKFDKSTKFIDVYVPSKLICEHKSAGKDLDDAEQQARNYLAQLNETENHKLPRYIVVCDFARMRFVDVLKNEQIEFPLAELPKHLELFNVLIDLETEIHHKQMQANIKAASALREFYQVLTDGKGDENSRLFIIRILFCLFAEDTGIFRPYQFANYLEHHTACDGSDTGALLNRLFTILNTPASERHPRTPSYLADFPYINGGIFAQTYNEMYFDEQIRQSLIALANDVDWGYISPEIFGTLFQEVLGDERRELGAHYTETVNIRKVIDSLFLDELKAEFAQIEQSKKGDALLKALNKFHIKLADLTFLDPACGTGNFLVAAYTELKRLETKVLQLQMENGAMPLPRVDIEHFYGIEIEPLAADIAKMSMWLAEHLSYVEMPDKLRMNAEPNIPLKKAAHIEQGNALRLDWQVTDYILGNPPFVGKTYQNAEQKQDTEQVGKEAGIKLFGSLDYVANWYVKAVRLLQKSAKTKVAFVSTNSICQGEQVPVLWNFIFQQGVHIHFAHQTFQWSSQAKDKAAVHCVIIGFGLDNPANKSLFIYSNIQGEPERIKAKNINGYLVNAIDVAVEKAMKQISGEVGMIYGSKPTDGGNLLLSTEEKDELLQAEPQAEKFIRPFLGAEEFLNGKERWCLWFADYDQTDLAFELVEMPLVSQRIENVRQMRLASTDKQTKKDAEKPHEFQKIRQPKSGQYLLIPRVSSENREFIPVGFLTSDTINSDANFHLPNASLYHFGILSSTMHNAFMRTVAGRLKSDYRYSNTIVYNNFPFPLTREEREKGVKQAEIKAVEDAAQQILDLREQYFIMLKERKAKYQAQGKKFPKELEPTLANLYNPPKNPLDIFGTLRTAHKELDDAVDKLYRDKPFQNEAERVAYLFELWQGM
ncbi:methylase [Pasteurellaceae bacterium LFhippo2]|nr:methylase [Pasteurellaceae bacterium LFhippo2]